MVTARSAANPRPFAFHNLWAKTDKETFSTHSLVSHSLETSAVASLLWDRLFVNSTRDIVSKGLGLAVPEARSWTIFLAGIHDLGKASPVFQSKWAPAVPMLQSIGYNFPPHLVEIPHGRISAIILKDLLAVEFKLDRKVATALARLTGGHHGTFDSSQQLGEKNPSTIGAGLWAESRTQLIGLLKLAAGLNGIPSKRDMAAYSIVGGLITVSDWIASSAQHFPYFPLTEAPLDLDEVLRHASHRAHDALAKLGWLSDLNLSGPAIFESLFSISTPRPMQSACIALAETIEHPSLVIIEAPMGEGKTEAALFLAERMRQRFQLRGIFVGLPTQATSNQMFSRVAATLSGSGYTGVGNLLLMHGHASLSAEFEQLRRDGYQAFAPQRIEEGEAPSLAAGEWFTHRKRGLLAPFGVGTVDQALVAALQSKHVFVRLAGLSGKVVIIDEVHAYDTYMSALLERLIAWLRAIGVTVILLSATLPAARRASLVNAFSPDSKLPCSSYPSITVASAAEVSTHSFSPSQPSRRVSIESIPSESESVAAWVAERIQNGGCAAVVCNTVARAQEIFKACRARFQRQQEDGLPTVDLLHSRYPFEARQERELRSLRRFGKPTIQSAAGSSLGSALRPRQAILVATQVIEQSLDLDFDVMVSELAPVDLLLQRIGRLHRHERPQRPTGSEPVLGLIATPLDDSDLPALPKAHTKVYDEHILLRTLLALGHTSYIRIPDDIQPLVEQVYTETWDVPGNEEMQNRLLRSRAEFDADQARQRDEAEFRYLPHPQSFDLQALTAMGRDDNENLHQFFQALTRLIGKTVTVVCLYGTDKNAFLDPSESSPATLLQPPGMKHVEQLLRRSCSLSHPGVVHAIEASTVPQGWRKSVLLRNCRPLFFDPAGTCRFGSWSITLDKDLGLTIEKATDA